MSRVARRLARALLVALLLTGVLSGSAHAATRAQAIVSLARAELAKGVREIPDGSNKAPAIRRYVASTSPSWFGAPWCAYFVSYVARRAGVPIGPSGRGLGYVPYIVSWAKRTKRWKMRPRPGYLVTWPNHVGIVETVAANGSFTTIEGNSANAVRRRWRRAGDRQGFVALAAGGKIAPSIPKRKAPAGKEAPLHARITFYPSSRVKVGSRLELSANDSSGPVDKVRWDFDGDGSYDDAKGDTASMKVVRVGRFPIAMRVYSRSGKWSLAKAVVTVAGADAPSARLNVPSTATVGKPIVADASGSKDPAGEGLSYEWDIDGDGQFTPGSERESITFDHPGMHQVAVRVRDRHGEFDDTSRAVVVAAVALPAVAVSCAQPSIPTGTSLTCTADTSASPVRITRIEWDSNSDGIYTRGSTTASLTYAKSGRQEVRVRVTDVNGRQATAATGVDVLNRLPTVSLKAPTAGRVGDPLVFDATLSTDPDGKVAETRWDVGNDGSWDAVGPKLTVTPALAGPLRVLVEVRDDRGATATKEATLEVRAKLAPVIGVLTPDPLVGVAVNLTAKDSLGGPFAKCSWDIDDNGRVDYTTTDCSQTVRATYSRTGTKTVKLTVEGTDGRVASVTTTLVVR